MSNTKPSNPKDLVALKKLDLSLAPATMHVMAATAFFEGALKYGRYNWRIAGVSASTYFAALLRHGFKWYNGQNADKVTRVHHLDNALACITILRDAEVYGKLADDRAPCPDPDAMANLIDGQEEIVAHLQQLFKDHKPHQYTIADTPQHGDGAAFVCGDPDLAACPTEAELSALLDAQLNGDEPSGFKVRL